CGEVDCQPSYTGAQVPSLPAFQTTTSTYIQKVAANRSLELDGSRQEWNRLSLANGARVRFAAPGNYRLHKIELAPRAVLELMPGDYWVEKLTLGSDARLQPVGSGTVRLHLAYN